MCIVCIPNNINRNVCMYLKTRIFPTTGYARVLLFMFIRLELGGTGTGCLFQFTYCNIDMGTFRNSILHIMFNLDASALRRALFNRKGALAWYGKLTWESAHAYILKKNILFNCLGYNFNIYGAFEFLCNSIANL